MVNRRLRVVAALAALGCRWAFAEQAENLKSGAQARL